ncbi:hypothetical protein OTU49_016583, partial [Cherax quadricarinatus]
LMLLSCQQSEQQWECVKTVCEDLDCPSEELHLEEGQCCPACKACEVQVGPELRQYGEGQSWHPPSQPCTLCVCHRGVPTCEPTLCPPQQQYPPPVVTPGRCRGVRCFRRLCFPGQEERLPPGSCCPVCAPASRGCVLWGRHLRTFDGVLLHHAHAHCVYTLATHCTTKLFTVYTKFVGESRGVVVSVVVEDLHLEVGADGTVLLDGATVHLPYLTHKVALYTLHGSVVLVTAVGLQVVWSVGGQVEVQVGGEHGGTTCGLCGNFNYLPQDDLRLPSGETSQSVEEYLESWSIGKECAAEPDSHHCSSASLSSSASSAHLDPAHRLCSVLKGASFRECHQLVPPEPYIRACRRELCACPGDMMTCLCPTLQLYSTMCTRAGVVLSWRTSVLCDARCPQGMVWSECVAPCGPPDCGSQTSIQTSSHPVISVLSPPLSPWTTRCPGPCVPGCTCPPGHVFKDSSCILHDDCPS